MIKRIHINQHIIRSNKKNGNNDPPITVIERGNRQRAHEVVVNGPCTVIYNPDKPLKCGARVWIETEAPVALLMRE